VKSLTLSACPEGGYVIYGEGAEPLAAGDIIKALCYLATEMGEGGNVYVVRPPPAPPAERPKPVLRLDTFRLARPAQEQAAAREKKS
jgi:hypothetical protein